MAEITLDLDVEERRYLAIHARYESNRQDDWRYQSKDQGERARLKARWREIADALHPNPNETPAQTAEREMADG